MVGVESITHCQILPSFTGKASSDCLGSAFCNTFKQLYLKDEKVNIIPSIKNKHCFIYLRRKAQNKSYLGIEHEHYIFGRHFEKSRHFGKSRPEYHNLAIHKYYPWYSEDN